MELKDILNRKGIIGVISSYKISKLTVNIKDLNIKNLKSALKMVNLDESLIDKDINELTINELCKIDLMTKLSKDIIIVGNLSNCLNYKDIEYMKKLFIKLNKDYNKKIVVIDEDINVFFNLTKDIFIMKNKEIIYETNDFFDDKLYEYVNMPKIIEFIKYVNKDKKRLDDTTDIYELIKDIYRGIS